MYKAAAAEEYSLACKQGTKEARELTLAGKSPNPAVLDELLGDNLPETVQEVGLVEIPVERIVGTKSAGRITAFSASFHPLLGPDTEFAEKWRSLCAAHLSDEGIRDPVLCYEYLGSFYIQEGNKRLSVMRHFGAPRIPGIVKRILPQRSQEPRIRAYFEFLEYYRCSSLYVPQYRRPGDYGKLLRFLGKKPGEAWTDQERRTFSAYFQYFREAFDSIKTIAPDVLPGEALLLWLELYPYEKLGKFSAAELKKTLAALAADVSTATRAEPVQVQTKAQDSPKANLLTRIITPDHVNVAFVHQLTPAASTWVLAHEEGRRYIETLFGSKVTCRSYFEANSTEAANEKIAQAVAEGAQVVFTTAPRLSRATLKAAVEHPKVRFFNCSVDQPYSSIRTYYGRIYEAKFITGAIAGAMAQNNRIGYIAAHPIFGVPASINAFALGAQLTNPRAQIELSWSCCEDTSQADFYADGIRVISNREAPVQNKMFLDFCSYGTYLMDDRGELVSLASPVWVWGQFYETVVSHILSGGKKDEKHVSGAVNYWLGMDSGVIDISLSDKLPAGIRSLAELLRQGLCDGSLDPFARKILAQDGTVKNDGTRRLSPQELLHMDWLCENIIGDIPAFHQILPMAQPMVRELGIYRDTIPVDKEVPAHENIDRIR